ncbi:MAG: hypothetical protein J6Y89_04890 [Lachnospiraceae bacterium]|nr:hypothetical protein [Lachnospiraceae bacterium]
MLNIELQCCGLAMLVILLLLYVREKNLDITSRRLFFRALISCIICISLDILSIVGIYGATYHSFPDILAKIICKMYVISLVIQSFQGFLYAAGEFFAVDSHKKLKIFYTVWCFAGCLLVAILPISFKMEGQVVYSYGPSTIATYVAVFVLIASTIVMAFLGMNHSSKRRRRAMLLWQARGSLPQEYSSFSRSFCWWDSPQHSECSLSMRNLRIHMKALTE